MKYLEDSCAHVSPLIYNKEDLPSVIDLIYNTEDLPSVIDRFTINMSTSRVQIT